MTRRRRDGLTDYRVRKKAVTSQGVLIAVRISGKNITAQFVKPLVAGDKVLVAVHSHALRKLGWKGSTKSTPAAYLIGLVAGRKALDKGVKEAFLYSGVRPFIRGSRTAAFMKGVVDGGIKIPISEDAFPAEDRLTGKFIAAYAEKLLQDDKHAYQRRFGTLLKSGFKPEEYPTHFETAKKIILGEKK
jgi:large subunit ribosomal protein L18